MSRVARSPEECSLKEFYQDLFEYCFPLNYRCKLRERFAALSQMGHAVRDFKREIERLGAWLSDVTDKDMAIQFWKGIHPYLRVELAGEDLNHENSSLDTLVKYATRFENRENLRQEELRNMSTVPLGGW